MKTSRRTLIARILLAIVLASASAGAAQAQSFRIQVPSQIGRIFGLEDDSEIEVEQFGDDFSDDQDDFGFTIREQNHGHNHNHGQRPLVASIPEWMVGQWDGDARPGGAEKHEITADGRFITRHLMFTAQGYSEHSRSSEACSYSPAGLRIGGVLYRVAASPNVMRLTADNGQSLSLRRPAPANQHHDQQHEVRHDNQNHGQQVDFNQNGQSPNRIKISGRGQQTAAALPAGMQGTWYEVSQNRRGEPVLSRYDLKADGSYDLLQYAIQGDEVDLNRPLGQLSQKASAQQRTLKFAGGQLTLAAGQTFAEGPFAVRTTTDASGQGALELTDAAGARLWTRQP